MLRLCALNITKSRDSKEDQHKKKSDSLHACYQITTTVPHMTLTKGIISQGRKTIIKNYLKKTKTNLSSSTIHVNVQRGEKVMTRKNKKYPKMDYQELTEENK